MYFPIKYTVGNKVDGPTVCVVLISATMCVIKGDCGSRD
jgi:hypothetical protein